MPGFSECIWTHEIYPVNMALTFLSSAPTYLGNLVIIQVSVRTWPCRYKTRDIIMEPSQRIIPLTEKGDKGNGDDFGVQLSLQCDIQNRIQQI